LCRKSLAADSPGLGRVSVLWPVFEAFRAAWGVAYRVRGLKRRVSKSALSCLPSTTEVANVTADLDTRCGELYSRDDDVLPGGGGDADRASRLEAGGFAASREQFGVLVGFLGGADAAGLSHAELEERLDRDGRELLRRLLDDHLALRAVREQPLEQVTGDEGTSRGRVESGHARALETVFGTVTVERLAYRAPGLGNLHPADAVLNLPVERHSHGLRRLAAVEAARGSFQDAVEAIERSTGQRLRASRFLCKRCSECNSDFCEWRVGGRLARPRSACWPDWPGFASRRHIEPCMRFSRTRLTDIVHRLAYASVDRTVPVRR
jgi:hypothetical protein